MPSSDTYFKKGHITTEEIKQKISVANKGKHNSPSTEFKKGLVLSSKWKKAISKKMKGNKHCFSRKLTEETKRKQSLALKGRPKPWFVGAKHPLWLGGKSFEPYTTDWTKTLKRSIRERDHYVCQVCGKEPSISVHHIDYNKKNCNPDNLIVLCRSCHTKTNYNRDYWIKYFYDRKT